MRNESKLLLPLTLCIALLTIASRGGGMDPASPMPEEEELISILRDAGLTGDASALATAIRAATHKNQFVAMQGLWTLARLGSAEALPTVEALFDAEMAEVRAYARVVAAQIRTNGVSVARDAAGVRAQVLALLGALHLSSAEVSAPIPPLPGRDMEEDETTLQRRWVLRECADVVRAAANRGVVGAASTLPVDPAPDEAARAKVAFAAWKGAERIGRLVDALAAKRTLTGDDRYPIQLLADEGAPAAPVIIAKLEAMRANRAAYHHSGYCALFRAVTGIGGKHATAAVASFRKDPDEWVRYYADQCYEWLSKGIRRNGVVAY
ncbi:MAG: hypothetical protein HY321_07640 [Armatimonadetes bacterium]|nr:hypothetical protein [Armatimonadota bacterium]